MSIYYLCEWGDMQCDRHDTIKGDSLFQIDIYLKFMKLSSDFFSFLKIYKDLYMIYILECIKVCKKLLKIHVIFLYLHWTFI